MEYANRKNIRLPKFDYSENGLYFITLCTADRRELFSDVVGAIHESPVPGLATCVLRPYGKILDSVIGEVPGRYNAEITDYVIMPDHVHLIIWLKGDRDSDTAIRESPLRNRRRSLLSNIVGYIKMNTSKRIHSYDPDLTVWQARYYDHIIRNGDDYMKCAKYIHDNPTKRYLENSG